MVEVEVVAVLGAAERHVLGQQAHRFVDHLACAAQRPQAVRQLQLEFAAALKLQPCGGFDDGAEGAADSAVVERERRVREGEGAFIAAVGTFEVAPYVFTQEGVSGERALDQRFDLGPQFGPHLAHRLAERAGMAAAEDGAIGVVIEQDAFRSPCDEHREAGPQHQRERVPQLGRPGGGFAQRTGGPVQRAALAPHRTRTAEQVQAARGAW